MDLITRTLAKVYGFSITFANYTFKSWEMGILLHICSLFACSA